MDLQNLTTQELIDLHIAVEDELLHSDKRFNYGAINANKVIDALDAEDEYTSETKWTNALNAFEKLTGYCLWDEDEDAIPPADLKALLKDIREARRLQPLAHTLQSFECDVKNYAKERGVV